MSPANDQAAHPILPTSEALADGRQSEVARDICRGALRVLRAHGFAGVSEVTLASGRRADILATDAGGTLWVIEIKSSLADFASDAKWPEYRDYCDRLIFAVAPAFPQDVLPPDAGLLIADRFGGEIVRQGSERRLSAARRKAVLITMARAASQRLHAALDPDAIVREVAS